MSRPALGSVVVEAWVLVVAAGASGTALEFAALFGASSSHAVSPRSIAAVIAQAMDLLIADISFSPLLVSKISCAFV